MRLAHISDLHFAKPSYSPLQFFSKRWIGNFNYLFSRRKNYDHSRLNKLPALFASHNIEHVIITGDLTTTAQHAEFKMACTFIAMLKSYGLKVYIIPGNHDHYTQNAFKQHRFHSYFKSYNEWDQESEYTLEKKGVTAKKVAPGWWIVALDTAHATTLFSSQGLFSPQIEAALRSVLLSIPSKEKVLLISHYPFFQHIAKHVRLARGEQLQAVIRSYPSIKCYLHGHTHHQTIADLRADRLPFILESGSTPHSQHGAFHLYDIDDKKLHVEVYRWSDSWQLSQQESYPW
jgi:3',5'-cyclic AMP phosphodiesterase CpdA